MQNTTNALPLAMLDRTVATLGDAPLIHDFETPIAARRVGALVDGLARALVDHGVRPGDRVALFLQNDPQFVVAMLAAWRAGAIAVPCNPMLRDRELAHHLDDCGAVVVVTLDELHAAVVRPALAARDAGSAPVGSTGTDPRSRPATGEVTVITTAVGDLSSPDAPLRTDVPPGTLDLRALASGGSTAELPAPPSADDVAVLTYTSGTTGPAKGAMSTHGNVAAASEIYRERWRVDRDDTILGIAPLYHVTGLTGHIGVALAGSASLILAHRFDAETTFRLTALHGATVTIAAITAYVALAGHPGASREAFATLDRTFSGGAPIPPATAAQVSERLGIDVRPVYGLTESTGPTHVSPLEGAIPVHAETGAFAVGLSAPGTTTRIVDADGREVATGVAGEIAIRGPQIVPGYWQRAEATAATFPDGELRTGDVGVVDDDGWLYVVDRMKDMIVASGFKVWPREVEDVLCEHASVAEAAVVGVPDDYRGETVHAFVTLHPGAEPVAPDALIAHCRARLAAYKYPRAVTILDELPKTTSGKILRRELRSA